MKYSLCFLVFFLVCHRATSQSIDTLIDVGGYHLRFHIIKGEGSRSGIPILFENGSGADVSSWDTIMTPLSEVTRATLIFYDRAGFGKSGVDSSNNEVDKHGILEGIKGLEVGLQRLGYDKDIILAASSFGGFYVTLYAAMHPDKVKAVVGVDMNHVSWFTDSFVNNEMRERIGDSVIIKARGLGIYYQQLNLRNIIDLMRKTPFPPTVPAIDLVSEFNIPDSALTRRWAECHRQFAATAANREGIFAANSGHVIYRDNPLLVVGAVVKAYTRAVDKEKAAEVLKRYLSYSLTAANEARNAVRSTGGR
jgi:pimeloyl-ACP methyl ester carboxylesterase